LLFNKELIFHYFKNPSPDLFFQFFAEGGHGIVVAGTNVTTGEEVALKFISLNDREELRATRFKHDHLLPVTDYMLVEGKVRFTIVLLTV